MDIKSCTNCKYGAREHWNTYQEPPEDRISCKNKAAGEYLRTFESDGCDIEPTWAENCSVYIECSQEDLDGGYEEPLSMEDEEILKELQIDRDRDHAIAMGWVDADGALTDAYFQASQQAYELSR